MARRSIRDLLRKNGPGRKAMTSDMRTLIDSFDAHKPAVRPADDMADRDSDPARDAAAGSEQPSDTAHSGTRT